MRKLHTFLAKKLESGNYYSKPSILFGLRIMLKGDQSENATEFMQNNFYDDSGLGIASSGQFKYLPLDTEQQNDQFFVDVDANKHTETINDIYKSRVKLINGNTQIEIMINCEILDSLEDELLALNTDLDDLVKAQHALYWQQIDLNNVLLTNDEAEIAENEGWGIFEIDGYGEDLQIQCSADANIFKSDIEAWEHVIAKAISDSEIHIKAIALIKLVSPDEFDEFVIDVDVVEVAELDVKYQSHYSLPWFIHCANGEIVEFESKIKACEAQRKFRKSVCLDPMTGE
jgi:hypothetical protein